MPNNICDTKDIIIVLLVLGMIYLLYKTRNTENFSTSEEISQAINDIYKADINAIRNLSNFATEIKNNNDSFTIPAKTINVNDLNGANAKLTNLSSDNATLKNITVDGTITYTNKNNTLSSLSDANITTLSNGNMLIYSDSKWINVQSIAGCYNGYITGGWTNVPPKEITAGYPFEVPIAGNYIINISASGWASGAGIIILKLYINGIDTTYSLKRYSNEVTSHKTLLPISFKYALNKGTNYLYLLQSTGYSNIDDFASFNYIYSP